MPGPQPCTSSPFTGSHVNPRAGFVNVVESKERLFAVCTQYGVPAIAAMGRKGGSNVAAAICNALVYSAAEMLDPAARGWQ